MALNNVLRTVWSARLIDAFVKQIVWGGDIIEDRSAEITGAKTLNINELTTAVTVGDYTKDTDMADPQLNDDSQVALVLNKQKFFHLYVDDLDKTQSIAPLMAKTVQLGTEAAAVQHDADAWAAVNGAIPTGQKLKKEPIAFTDARAKTFVEEMLELNELMDRAHVPASERFCVVPSNVKRMLLQYLIGRVAGAGGDADTALHNAQLSQLLAMTVRMDTQIATTAAAGSYFAICGHRTAVQTAATIANLEMYRPEKRFGDAVKGLFVYGHAAVKANRLWALIQKD